MNATIITIGDELLIGQVVDTNSAWLAAELTALGFRVMNLLSISDTAESIKTAVDGCLNENELILMTGGLGPTNDDVTRRILAEFFGSEMVFSEEVMEDVEAFISGIGGRMNEHNRLQAVVPEKAEILRNRYGTAPGMLFSRNGKIVISLPGVPREMKGIFGDHLKDLLKQRFSLPNMVYKTVMLTGIGEAPLAEKLTDWEGSLPQEISLAYLPSPGIIRLRLGASGDDEAGIRRLIDSEIEKLRNVAGDYIYGFDNMSLEEAVGELLMQRGASMATAESCTGGTIASRITAIPGCSAWFRGGVVAYANDIKQQLLGVSGNTLDSCGAVSEETVREMAEGVRKKTGADYAVATSGIAGPDGGSPEKPVGTVWMAVSGPQGTIAKKFSFGTKRDLNILRSSIAAMNLLRKMLEG